MPEKQIVLKVSVKGGLLEDVKILSAPRNTRIEVGVYDKDLLAIGEAHTTTWIVNNVKAKGKKK